MEFEEKSEQKLDLFVLLDDFLKEAKKRLALAVVLVLVCSAGMVGYRYMTYSPVYAATVSFTVKVANPMYSGISSYNTKTAEQMAATFPYILTSGVLQERVKEHLGISYLPSVSVSADATSSIITMQVTDSDPQRAYDVLNAVITYYPEIAEFVVGSTVLVLLDESGVPSQPVNTVNLKSPALKGAMTGGLLWAALVAILAMAKDTIHNEEELKRILSTPCISQIPAVKLTRRAPCPLVHKSRRYPGFAEAIRLLRRRIEKLKEEQGTKVLLVSSAIPGEGKTTVSVNLAISLAKKGSRVLVIDCDLRNPSVAKVLQMSCRNSLMDYLQGKQTVRDILSPTDVENLFVISGGAGVKNYAEQLSQERIARLVQAARNLFDYVILDTPPCSLLADAAEVAKLADCGIMVIRQDYASREQILDGIRRLGDGNLPLIGCAINGVQKSLSGGYGYSYGYGYGYGRKND